MKPHRLSGSATSSPWRLLPHLLFLLLALTATAQPLIPDHTPMGSPRPLVTGDNFTLPATRLFTGPSFTDSSWVQSQDHPAELVGARGNFYQVKLATVDNEAGGLAWVYRSELEVRKLAGAAKSPSVVVPKNLALDTGDPPPAKGDSLVLQSPVFYSGQDLLGEHELLSGRQVMRVLAPENAQGFLQVRDTAGKTGWIHRAELPEERRSAR